MPDQTIFMSFDNFLPDAGEFRNPQLTRVDNVIPFGGRYLPSHDLDLLEGYGDVDRRRMRAFMAYDNRWLYSIEDWNGTLAGHLVKEWDYTGANSATTRHTFPTSVGSIGGSLLRFGDNVIAAHIDAPLAIQASRQSAFTSPMIMSTDAPRAKYVTAIGERILLGNIANTGTAGSPDPNPHLVWWSATNDTTTFGNPSSEPEKRTDFQPLFDEHGEITGLAGGRDFAFIFKERAIYRMSSGGPFDFSFTPISQGIGTQYPRSIVPYEDVVFFWGPNGPSVVDFSGVRNLASNKVSRHLLDPNFGPEDRAVISRHSYNDVVGGIDVSTSCVLWSFKRQFLGPRFLIVVYNFQHDMFSFIDMPDHGGGFFNNVDGITSRTNHDGEDWRPLANMAMLIGEGNNKTDTPGVVGGDTLTSLYRFDPDALSGESSLTNDMVFRTGYFELAQSRRVKINSVKPAVGLLRSATTRPTFTVTVESLEDPSDPTASSKSSSVVADGGWVDLEGVQSAPLHRITLSISLDSTSRVSEIEGVWIDYTVTGEF